jgi:hypothetical protein
MAAMLISVQVCCGTSILRPFGLVKCDGSSTLSEMYSSLCEGVLECGDDFVLVLPEKYTNFDVKATVGDNTVNTQSVPLSATLGEVVSFGKYCLFPLSQYPKSALGLYFV